MEIIEKPWGKEEVLEINEKFMVKRLTMKFKARCSIQYHEKKKETIYVLQGKLGIYLGNEINSLDYTIYSPGDVITISPGEIHRMEGVTDTVYIECSTPEMEDVIRLKDDYNRV